jgi:hypothetical protein
LVKLFVSLVQGIAAKVIGLRQLILDFIFGRMRVGSSSLQEEERCEAVPKAGLLTKESAQHRGRPLL